MARPVNPLFRGPDGKFSQELYDAWHYQQNQEKKKKKQSDYRKANPEKARLAVANWVKANPEKKKACDKALYERTKSIYIQRATDRHAKKLNAMPSWLTKEDRNAIAEIYKQCRDRSEADGIQYNVDHIVPLQGKNVCGLHVPWNLQVLTEIDNKRKHNDLN